MANSKLCCKQCGEYKPADSMKKNNVHNFCNINCMAAWGLDKSRKAREKFQNKKRKSKPAKKPNGKVFRSKPYLNWVKTLPCCMCGAPADDPHHIIGYGHGGMGTKAPDDMTMPLCRGDHDEMHAKPELWRLQKGFIIATKKKADLQGIKYAY